MMRGRAVAEVGGIGVESGERARRQVEVLCRCESDWVHVVPRSRVQDRRWEVPVGFAEEPVPEHSLVTNAVHEGLPDLTREGEVGLIDIRVLDGWRNGANPSELARGKKTLELHLTREVRELAKYSAPECCRVVGSSGEEADSIEVKRVQHNVQIGQLGDHCAGGTYHGLAGSAEEGVQVAVLIIWAPGEAQARLEVVEVVPAGGDDVVPLKALAIVGEAEVLRAINRAAGECADFDVVAEAIVHGQVSLELPGVLYVQAVSSIRYVIESRADPDRKRRGAEALCLGKLGKSRVSAGTGLEILEPAEAELCK